MTAKPTVAESAGITLSQEMPVGLDSASTIQISPAQADAAAVAFEGSRNANRQASNPPKSERIRYAILGEAGRGGMATVYVAQDLELMRKVALKQLADDLRDVGPARLRFLREVQVTAQLDHPYIVPVYGLEVTPEGSPAYAMKLVTGNTLADYLQTAIDAYAAGGVPAETHCLPARIEHLLKVCDAVDYAHGKGVIHRDLKPANIMLGAHGETFVMDWGICHLFGTDDPEFAPESTLSDTTGGLQTEYGAVVGTPRYMSPEQAQGRREELGPQSDQCALGLILFELVTLSAPFAGDSMLEVMQNAAAARRATVVHAYEQRAIPAPLRAIIERATRYDPKQRYSSVSDFADDLRRYLRGEAVHALPDSSWQRAQRYVGRHRQGMLLSVLGLIAAAAIGFTAMMWRHEQQAEAARAREVLQRGLMEHAVQQGDRLQLALLQLQNELESLAAAATQLLQHGVPAENTQIYWAEDYLSAERRPPDLAMQAELGHVASMEWAVWSAAPGVEQAPLKGLVERLSHLRGYRNELLETTRRNLGGGQYANGMLELSMALESGLLMRYPGRAIDQSIDPRKGSWYVDSKSRRESHWGTPFVDHDGGNVLLPLTSPMRDANGQFIGALSMDMALDFVVRNLLHDQDADDAGHRLLLLDTEGRVLASRHLPKVADKAEGDVMLRPFGDATLRAAFQADDVGAVTTHAFGMPEIVAFDRIHPVGWILVLVSPDPDAQ
ncbi:MAG: protein kinase domain-containing protein [Pseudomarimonas sp.]